MSQFFSVSVAIRGKICLRESMDTPPEPRILALPDQKVQPSGEIRRRHPFFVCGIAFWITIVNNSEKQILDGGKRSQPTTG